MSLSHNSYFIVASLFLLSCNSSILENTDKNDSSSLAVTRTCGTQDVYNRQLAQEPELKERMNAIEQHTANYIKSIKFGKNPTVKSIGQDVTINIPIAIHVIYNTSQENISDIQIQSQIDVLNQDFNALNTDFSLIPATFSGVQGTLYFKFTLVSIDRKYSSRTSWGTNDDCKSPTLGGVAAISPTNVLNIWVCNIGNNILGYAQFPGGAPATDGVVVGPNFFGTTGYVSNPYNKGRTATHEIGHWMNLRHIWGDSECGDDLVDDTPQHRLPNGGCPNFPKTSSCSGEIEMTMNFMDYTYDACMYMFTMGQKLRARAIFSTGGPRSEFAPAVSNEPANVYRFFSQEGVTHYLSTNGSFGSGSNYWVNEGVAFRAYSSQVNNSIPVYRYYASSTRDHYYTIDGNFNLSNGYWAREGAIFYAYNVQMPGTVPIYRYWSQQGTDHYITKDANFNLSNGYWVSEGIAFYAYP